MSPQAWGAISALGIFALTAVFYAGKVSARLDALEAWRLETRADFLQLRRAIDEVKTLLQPRPPASRWPHGDDDERA